MAAEGYQFLEHNFRVRFGEVDIVVLKDEQIVFVEVKTRTSDTFGLPEDAVTPSKMEKLVDTALMWLQEHPNMPDNWRIDVIAILLNQKHQLINLEHFINVN